MTHSGTETILLIDDDEAVRNGASTYLSGLGYRVLVAEDGKQGLETHEQNADQIDLVLLDLSMPNMSGREVLRELRQLNPEVKVIIFTGYPVYAEELEEPVLLKPIRTQEVAGKIRELLDAD